MGVNTKVETVARLAQWKIESLGPSIPCKRSDPFKIGLWNWYLSVEKLQGRSVLIRLFPEPSLVAKEQPPLARFFLRVTAGASYRKPYFSQMHEKLFGSSGFHFVHFSCPVDINWENRFIIGIEFLDLTIYTPQGGRKGSPIWPNFEHLATRSSQRMSRMLNDSILADITINTVDGKLRAHRAILSASSPVFHRMFVHKLKEKESSTIKIEDMTYDSCSALVNYLYGSINQDDFWKHRLALLGAAVKYDIKDLKDVCEDSLLEDLSVENVLERLQEAWLYKLDKLKKGCFMYLLDFGKIYDVREEMCGFFRNAERELVVDMFKELLDAWKTA